MAKSRAQRKAEARKRREQELAAGDASSDAQRRTQVPESREVAEAEAAIEAGMVDASRISDSPAPSRADVGRPDQEETPAEDETPAERISRREKRKQQKQEAERSQAQLERRAPKERVQERQRGAVVSFFGSVRKELQKVQWPDRDTLVQASAVTLIFVAIAAAYLGVLDAIFSRVVELII